MSAEDRAWYVAGLRQLADLLERHEDLPLPTHGGISWLLFGTDDERQVAAQVIRGIGGEWAKQTYAGKGPETLLAFQRSLAGLRLDVTVHRAAVCERVVVGTHTVTKQVPDPAVAVPMVEVTEEIEQVEWRCSPLLADAPAGGAQ